MEVSTPTRAVGGRYRLLGLLGEGGMARVFDAYDERLERRVAVKILRPDTAALAGMARRFQQEARLAARLVHPNIVAVLDFGEEGSLSYLVMERLSGRTLRDEIAAGPLDSLRVVRVLTETLSALSAAHRLGVLHRDVKPSNILLQDDGLTKISDFGIAKSMDPLGLGPNSEETLSGIVLGTPGYLAPERGSGLPATVESDLYSVGAVMVEALTGRRVPVGQTTIIEMLPPEFRAVARQALSPDPANRYHSAAAMLQAVRHPRTEQTAMLPNGSGFRRVASTGVPSTAGFGGPQATQVSSTSASAPGPHRRPGRRRRVALVIACALVAMFGVALALVTMPGALQPSTATLPNPANRQISTDGGTTQTTQVDPVASAIRAEAQQLAAGGLPGDASLAVALDDTADQPAGPGRQAAAQQDMELGQVLLDGGGISSDQYQSAVAVLEQTGATVPATTTTLPPQVTNPVLPTLPLHGHHHRHGGNDQGESTSNIFDQPTT